MRIFIQKGWGCSSVVEYLPSMCKAQGLISSTAKRERRRENNRGGRERQRDRETETERLIQIPGRK
jgi:hypothetical protein